MRTRGDIPPQAKACLVANTLPLDVIIARVRARRPARWTAVWTASVHVIGGHFQEVVPFDCPDDGAAKEQAKQLVDRGERNTFSHR